MTLAADVQNTTIAWFTVGGALGGVLLTGLLALVVASAARRRAARRDHERQLRLDRRECYAAYWLAWNRFHHDLRTTYLRARSGEPGNAEQLRASEVDWRAATTVLSLLGGPSVLAAVRGHVDLTDAKLAQAQEGQWQRDEDGAAYRALSDAMRADLLGPVPR